MTLYQFCFTAKKCRPMTLYSFCSPAEISWPIYDFVSVLLYRRKMSFYDSVSVLPIDLCIWICFALPRRKSIDLWLCTCSTPVSHRKTNAWHYNLLSALFPSHNSLTNNISLSTSPLQTVHSCIWLSICCLSPPSTECTHWLDVLVLGNSHQWRW
jgi:hypothetical protein